MIMWLVMKFDTMDGFSWPHCFFTTEEEAKRYIEEREPKAKEITKKWVTIVKDRVAKASLSDDWDAIVESCAKGYEAEFKETFNELPDVSYYMAFDDMLRGEPFLTEAAERMLNSYPFNYILSYRSVPEGKL